MRCLLLFLGSFKLVVGSCDDADEVLVRLISSVAFGLASRRRRTQAMKISVGEVTLPAEYGKKKKSSGRKSEAMERRKKKSSVLQAVLRDKKMSVMGHRRTFGWL
jgi:hypothetical protein